MRFYSPQMTFLIRISQRDLFSFNLLVLDTEPLQKVTFGTGHMERVVLIRVKILYRISQKNCSPLKGAVSHILDNIDEAWIHGFSDAKNPEPVSGKWHNRIVPFVSCVNSLLSGEPVGRSLEDLNNRYNELNSILSNIIDQAVKKSIDLSPEFFREIADLFVTRSNAQNYMVFGDPAVSLNINL